MRHLFLTVSTAALLLFTAVVVTATAAAQAIPAQSADEAARNAAERATFERVCTFCHDASMVEGGTRTPMEWDDVLERMAANGADASEEEAVQIRTFLLRNFGRANVNRATARDLAPVLNVDAAVAAAVVDARTEQGGFKTLDDLKKVPGIDAVRLDARKERVIF